MKFLKAEQAELNEIKANITAKEKERKETEELITEKTKSFNGKG